MGREIDKKSDILLERLIYWIRVALGLGFVGQREVS